VLAIVMSAGAAVRAQSGGGQVSGVVHDEQGGVLPGITVVLRNQETGVARTAVTGADGRFHFPALAPGLYTLRSELSGFAATEVRDVTMTIGLELLLQVFNFLNTENLQDQYGGGRVNNALSANFGRIFTARPMTQGEVAAKLVW
jgi:hypothetical protein